MQTKSQYVAVNVRVLSWPSANGTNETLNDKDPGMFTGHKVLINVLWNPRHYCCNSTSVLSGTFLPVTKQLDSGDHLTLQLPISLRTKTLKGRNFPFVFIVHLSI